MATLVAPLASARRHFEVSRDERLAVDTELPPPTRAANDFLLSVQTAIFDKSRGNLKHT